MRWCGKYHFSHWAELYLWLFGYFSFIYHWKTFHRKGFWILWIVFILLLGIVRWNNVAIPPYSLADLDSRMSWGKKEYGKKRGSRRKNRNIKHSNVWRGSTLYPQSGGSILSQYEGRLSAMEEPWLEDDSLQQRWKDSLSDSLYSNV